MKISLRGNKSITAVFDSQVVRLDVIAPRVVDLDNIGLRVVGLDVFCIWQGCVVRLDVGREIDCYCNDKSRFEWLIIYFFNNRHEKVCYFFGKYT